MAEFFNRQWRLPNEENKNKISNYSLEAFSQGDFVTVEDFPFGSSQSFTISFWVYGSDLVNASTKSFIGTEYYTNSSPSTQFGFALNFSYGKIQFYTSPINGSRINTFYTANNVLIENEWNHIILRYNYGTDYRIYHNNTLKAVYDSNWSGFVQADVEVQYNTQTLWMYRGYYANYNLVGKMAEFNCFGYALTDTATSAGQTPTGQVAAIYGDGSSLPNPMSLSPKPVVYFPLGDQDAFNGANYLVPNSSLKDYVFDFVSSSGSRINCGPSGLVGSGPINSINGTITIGIWINTTSTSGNEYPIMRDFTGSDWRFRRRSDTGRIHLAFLNTSSVTLNVELTGSNDPQGNPYIVITDGKWHHIVGVYNGTDTAELYIDGILQGTTTSANFGTLNTTARTVIGGSNNSNGNPLSGQGNWNGNLSNAQIWNTNLISSEITTLFNNGSPIQTLASIPQNSNLKVWYKLDASATYDSSTTTWTIPDDSSNSNDGTSSGMTQANLVQSDLSFTSGYSPFGLNFDAASSDYITLDSLQTFNNEFSVSVWLNPDDNTEVNLLGNSSTITNFLYINSSNQLQINSPNFSPQIFSNTTLSIGSWQHVILTRDSNNIFRAYKNGDLLDTSSAASGAFSFNQIGRYGAVSTYIFNGKLSNISIWDTALTSAQVSEIYNEGVPSNLNNHSAYSNLVSWWQLGSNSSFNSNSWTVLDEKGTNDGVSSTNMSEVDIVNGVGYSSNGVSSGMSDNVIGDAPYSTANSLSVNMDVLDRTTDVPS